MVIGAWPLLEDDPPAPPVLLDKLADRRPLNCGSWSSVMLFLRSRRRAAAAAAADAAVAVGPAATVVGDCKYAAMLPPDEPLAGAPAGLAALLAGDPTPAGRECVRGSNLRSNASSTGATFHAICCARCSMRARSSGDRVKGVRTGPCDWLCAWPGTVGPGEGDGDGEGSTPASSAVTSAGVR